VSRAVEPSPHRYQLVLEKRRPFGLRQLAAGWRLSRGCGVVGRAQRSGQTAIPLLEPSVPCGAFSCEHYQRLDLAPKVGEVRLFPEPQLRLEIIPFGFSFAAALFGVRESE
jgi:hypothetical protein